MGFAATIIMACKRSYEAFDVVVTAVENSTVEFVGVIEEESKKAVPIIIGAIVTLILLLLKIIVQKYSTTTKEIMKMCGESPEGNAMATEYAVGSPRGLG